MTVKELIESLSTMSPNAEVALLVSAEGTDYERDVEKVMIDPYDRHSVLITSPVER